MSEHSRRQDLPGPRVTDTDEDIERLLRAALHARTRAVDLGDLRPPAPPTTIARTHVPVRRVLAVVFGLAAAGACALLVVAALPTPRTSPVHIAPASRNPGATGTPSPASAPPTPRPAHPGSQAAPSPNAATITGH